MASGSVYLVQLPLQLLFGWQTCLQAVGCSALAVDQLTYLEFLALLARRRAHSGGPFVLSAS